jgi:hypothetical protein
MRALRGLRLVSVAGLVDEGFGFILTKPLHPKVEGRSLMILEFMCDWHGPLKLFAMQHTNNPGVPEESLIILKPGKNGGGWWKNCDLVKQLQEKAIPIFQILHPDTIGLFMFAPRCVASVHVESQSWWK